jgi:hypothetical protein
VVSCREIRADDVDGVVDLLTRGFGRGRDYWSGAFRRLAEHRVPAGLPQYGYVLDADSTPVGVVLLIFTDVPRNGVPETRCNISSWYVEPAFRSFAAILAKRAIRCQNVTYFNVSPALHTWPILERQGFAPFAAGRVIAFPALSRHRSDGRVDVVAPGISPGRDLEQSEIDVLVDHGSYGCLSLICHDNGQRYPFVFGLDRRSLRLPVAHLVYCRSMADLIRLAKPIGRFLLRRGYRMIKFHADGPTPGIPGHYFGGKPKFRKGGESVWAGDVAYSEQVMFGY